MDINILLFEGFETLDVFGPVELLGEIEEYNLHYYSISGGIIGNRHGIRIETMSIAAMNTKGILLVPGGMGTRGLVSDAAFLSALKSLSDEAEYCLSICTGSVLLGKCGALDGRCATSNKLAMEWVKSVTTQVNWIERARWVVDGKFYTSSGVSAGMDMSLGFLRDRFGEVRANEVSSNIEYLWNRKIQRMTSENTNEMVLSTLPPKFF